MQLDKLRNTSAKSYLRLAIAHTLSFNGGPMTPGLILVLGWAISALGVVALLSLIGTITLQMTADEPMKTAQYFGESFKAMVTSALVAVATCLLLIVLLYLSGEPVGAVGIAVLIFIGFLVNAGVLSSRFQDSDRGEMSFGRALWLTTLQLAFAAMLAGAAVKVVEFITS